MSIKYDSIHFIDSLLGGRGSAPWWDFCFDKGDFLLRVVRVGTGCLQHRYIDFGQKKLRNQKWKELKNF